MTYINSKCVAPFPFFLDKFIKELLDINLDNVDSNVKANIYTSENGKLFELALPGVEKKDIEITFEDNVLIIKAKNANGEEIKRGFELDYKVDAEKISSSLENGILRVAMPKRAEEKKIINITIA